MYGCVLFMEDEAWDVYVSTTVYKKKKAKCTLLRIVMNEINSAKREKKSCYQCTDDIFWK